MVQVTKQFFLMMIFAAGFFAAPAQNIGIGVSSPQQKLEVNGAIKIGSNDAVNPSKGTMRWNSSSNRFEGFDGTQWIVFGNANAGNGNLIVGDTSNYSYESAIYDPAYVTNGYDYPSFGTNMVRWKNYYLAGAPFHNARAADDGFNVYMAGKAGMFQQQADGRFTSVANFVSTSPGEEFAFGRAIAADDQHFIIAEPKGGSVYYQGKIYVYNSISGTPVTITANDPVSFDEFGSSVGVQGNYIVVGAPQKTDAGNVRRGKFYIFKKGITGIWTQHQAFVGTVAGTQLGKAVGITSEFMAVSSTGTAYNGYSNHGSVNLYKLNNSTGNWTFHSTVRPADNAIHKNFGARLVLKGDTLMVAEYPMEGQLLNRLYMFIRINDVWTQVKEFTVPGTYVNDGFAAGFDFSGNKVVIGQSTADMGAALYGGKAHLFEWNGSDWVHRSVLRPTVPVRNIGFGNTVLIDDKNILITAIRASGLYEKTGIIYGFALH